MPVGDLRKCPSSTVRSARPAMTCPREGCSASCATPYASSVREAAARAASALAAKPVRCPATCNRQAALRCPGPAAGAACIPHPHLHPFCHMELQPMSERHPMAYPLPVHSKCCLRPPFALAPSLASELGLVSGRHPMAYPLPGPAASVADIHIHIHILTHLPPTLSNEAWACVGKRPNRTFSYRSCC